MSDTIVLSVQIEAAAGKGPELLKHLSALLEPSRKEPGCLSYVLHTDPEHQDRLFFYEAFRDQAALDKHLAEPHFQEFVNWRQSQDPDPMADVTVTRWKPVA
jgi:quinol monooxygenase YgiN